MVQLVEENQVNEHDSFQKYTAIEVNSIKLNIYIEKELLQELANHTVIIDARTWTLFGKLKGSLFMNFL